jgi:hypothetical protein
LDRLFGHLDVFLNLDLWLGDLLCKPLFAEHVLGRLLHDRGLDSVLGGEFVLFVEDHRHRLLSHMLYKLFIAVQVFKQLVHDVFGLLLIHLWHGFARLNELLGF